MPRVRIEVDKQLIEEARHLYEEGVVPVKDIATMLGMVESTLYRRRQEWKWKERPRLRRARPQIATPPLVPDAPDERIDIVERIRRAVEREIETVEQVLATAPLSAARSPAVRGHLILQ